MFAVIHIPDFQLQAALRLEPELHRRPVVLLEDTPVKPVVFQLTDAAREAGVCRGQTTTQAMARCREVIVKTRARAREDTVTAMLLQCAYGFSPAIEATAEGVCTLDLKGLSTADDPEKWAIVLLDSLRQLQLRAQIGVAETPHLALLAAKQARPFLFAQNADFFVSALPLEVLGPSAAMLEILEMWGIRTIGAFLQIGKENLAERLGPEAVDLFDSASSRQIRPLNLVVPAETFEEAMDFEQPVESLEPLLFVLRRFIEQLVCRLEMFYLVAADLQLRLGLASGDPYERLFVIPSPTRDVETLFRMLQTHLENVRTDAPISSLKLGARPGQAANYQFGLFNAALRDPNQFHETLARLSALLGTDRVGTPHLLETHRPDSFRMDLEGLTTPRDEDLSIPQTQEPSIGLALRRFRPPLPAIVEMRAEKPSLLRSAAFTGPIAGVRGPWRISGQWWDRQAWSRDEWDIQTGDGGLFRLARQEEQWFVDGIFD
jgi:protein ImuB